jgi:uncharacterized membrane protein
MDRNANVITVSFGQSSSAYEALSNLKELDGQGQVSVHGAAVLERDADGGLSIKDRVGDAHLHATTTGGLIGLLLGILAGPFGIFIGGITGLLVGSLFDIEDQSEEGSVLAAISTSVRPGQTVLVAVVTEQSDEVVDSAMTQLGGTVARHAVEDVEAEIAAAADAQKVAQREARAKLRTEREHHVRDEVHAKLEALKAKL